MIGSSPTEAHPMAATSTDKSGKRWRGDDRMNRAVQAKYQNPRLSLEMALRLGGFDYPSNAIGPTLDAEQVSLRQRKNQLSRRLRQAKQHGLQPLPEATIRRQPLETKPALGHNYKPESQPVQSTHFQSLPPLSVVPLSHQEKVGVSATTKTTSANAPSLTASNPLAGSLQMTNTPQQPNSSTRWVILTVLMPANNAVGQGFPQSSPVASVKSNDVPNPNGGDCSIQSTKNGSVVGFQEPGVSAPSDLEHQKAAATDPLFFLEGASEVWASKGKSDVAKQEETKTGLVGNNNPAVNSDPRFQRALAMFAENMKMSGSCYQQAMRRAGFQSEETSMSSSKFHDFASAAWLRESQRLQAAVHGCERTNGTKLMC
ncbi:expressed unknown protein [Seminavis robusta]|uniref:Uncharacterized protein n=1 Tax=Seminavis robusta TaxID=568900 RepID=A0A9N8I0B4_9STRA|nr:expressed unknown protein [Seminavis robusta]|eukprot:Sro2612_g332610.2  (372) ;mRNA; f:10174-11289